MNGVTSSGSSTSATVGAETVLARPRRWMAAILSPAAVTGTGERHHQSRHIFTFSNIFKIKLSKSEEKLRFGLGGFECLNLSPSQNFVATSVQKAPRCGENFKQSQTVLIL